MIKLIPIALAAALLAGLSSCGNRAEKKFDVSSYEDTPDTLTHHARYITISAVSYTHLTLPTTSRV